MINKKLAGQLKDLYNPEGGEKRLYQLTLLKLMKEFDSYAKENGIVYSLAYGTLLGAIRHGGFIPWDDDVDLIMDRSNWTCLKSKIHSDGNITSVMKIHLEHGPYVIGYNVKIDIMILDFRPHCNVLAFLKEKICQFLKLMLRSKIYFKNKDFRLRKPYFFLMPFSYMFSEALLSRWLDACSQLWMNDEKCSECQSYNDTIRDITNVFPKDILSEYYYTQFENHFFPIIKKYDIVLTQCYGNWKELPQKIKDHRRI